jgi:SAM-dependent methyltransferase
LRLPLIDRWLDLIAPASVLEVGCGMGAMGYRLASRFDYRGYEPDPTSFRAAATRLHALGRGEVRNSEVPDPPDRLFDAVVAFEVLEHIEDDLTALRGWLRWVRPGGHAIFSVPAHPERFGPCDVAVGHCRRYTRGSLQELLREAGLAVLSIESWGMPAGYALEAARNRLAARRTSGEGVGTSGSGRLYQPPTGWGRSVEWAMWPLTAVQRLFRDTDRGIGYVAVGRLTPGPT